MTASVLRASLDGVHGQTLASKTDSVDSTFLDNAVNGLRIAKPEMSAASPMAAWQSLALYSLASAGPVVIALLLLGYGEWLGAVLTLPFAVVVLLRFAALWHLIWPGDATPTHIVLDDALLPTYSVLVPVYNEAAVAPALVQAIAALDYPASKLDVIFITEETDDQTRAALRNARLPPHMRILTVPRGLPQTKPRALNYALQFAHAELVAVYDAEDVPEPTQLRKAAACFASAGQDLACVQARLSTYNPNDGFLAKQFTLEYSVLFEAILPALARLGLPILLGGTSNHFRRETLVEAGGWDAFNVTEDADLGIRLARLGYRVAMLDSDTWEEAPQTMRVWLGQRTRWLKGWIQTFLVHTRQPSKLMADLRPWGFYGVQVMLAGMILSALVHPWFYVAALASVLTGNAILSDSGLLWMVCWFNFVAGHLVGVLLGLISAWRSQGRIAIAAAIDLPFYWLAISVASYLAIWDLYKRPFYWEKTPHAARRVSVSQDVAVSKSAANPTAETVRRTAV